MKKRSSLHRQIPWHPGRSNYTYMTMNAIQPPALIDLDVLAEAAHCLRTIAHPHRLRMIHLLLTAPQTVGELAEACGIAGAAASEHLRLMTDRGLLTARRDGRRVYHEVAEPGLEGIIHCIEQRFGEK